MSWLGRKDDAVGHLLLNQESLVGRIFLVHPRRTLIHDIDHQDLIGVSWNTIKKKRNTAGLTLSPTSPAGPLSPCKKGQCPVTVFTLNCADLHTV